MNQASCSPESDEISTGDAKSLSMCLSAKPQILEGGEGHVKPCNRSKLSGFGVGVVERGLWSILGSELNAYRNQPEG